MAVLSLILNRQNPAPTDTAYRKYHSIYLSSNEISRYRNAARELLAVYGTNLIDVARPEFLWASLQEYQSAASAGHSAFRWWGTVEAAGGALIWSILLVLGSFLVAWFTHIDILDSWHKALKIISGA